MGQVSEEINTHIAENLLDTIFDYGVSENQDDEDSDGQGLFVSATYLAKMGGRISAKNLEVGVEFVMELPVMAR